MEAELQPLDGRPTVVIADDDETVLDILALMFEKGGFRAERASDGFEALRKIEAVRPDLLVLDLMMPHRNGLQVVKDLQTTAYASLPVLAYTARVLDSALSDFFRGEPNVAHFEAKMASPKRLPEVARKILAARPPRPVDPLDA